MGKKSFPITNCNWSGSTPEQTERWRAACERASPDVVRSQAAHVPARAAISIDSETNVTAGFAHEWLRWMDEQKSRREYLYKRVRIGVTVVIAAVGGLWAIFHK